MNEKELREAIVRHGRSLHSRGLSAGSSGNLSVRLEDGFLVTPTKSCLGTLDPSRISRLDGDGNLVSGDPPTKEDRLHLAVYERRPEANAVVHLHSTYSVALSCLKNLDPLNVVPPITPYSVMRLGRVRSIAYHPPGDPALAEAIAEVAEEHHVILMENHGPVVAGRSLDEAVYAMEELEETARLVILLHDREVRLLTAEQVAELQRRFS